MQSVVLISKIVSKEKARELIRESKGMNGYLLAQTESLLKRNQELVK